jgi:hypothetical protein
MPVVIPFTFVLMVMSATARAEPCHEGDVDAAENADLEVLEGSACLRGSLNIGGKVSSLRALRALVDIEGDLRIQGAERLSSLRGLDALARVAGTVAIGGPKEGTPMLRHVDGLGALLEIGGDLWIAGGYIFRPGRSLDAPIRGVTGLASLTTVKGSVTLFDLEGFRGLNALREIGGDLVIEHCDFATLGGLRRLERIGGTLRLVWNSRLRRIDGLGALTEVGGDVELVCGGRLKDHTVRRHLPAGALKGKLRQLADTSVPPEKRPICQD